MLRSAAPAGPRSSVEAWGVSVRVVSSRAAPPLPDHDQVARQHHVASRRAPGAWAYPAECRARSPEHADHALVPRHGSRAPRRRCLRQRQEVGSRRRLDLDSGSFHYLSHGPGTLVLKADGTFMATNAPGMYGIDDANAKRTGSGTWSIWQSDLDQRVEFQWTQLDGVQLDPAIAGGGELIVGSSSEIYSFDGDPDMHQRITFTKSS